MNERTDHEKLLADVLVAEADPGFSAGVLAATLGQVRRRRRLRHVRLCGVTLAVLLAVTVAGRHLLRRGVQPELAAAPQPASCQLVVSQPLRAGQLIATQPLATDQCVVSTALVQVIRTRAGGFGEIGDDELMALAAPNVVALVRRGPHEAELVFVSAPAEHSEDRSN
jgi:hypothetical protein